MDFEPDEEQRAVIETSRSFVRKELVPHEEEVERTGRLDHDLAKSLRDKAIRAGLYAANMPEELGGGGLDTLTWMLMERELGHTGYALQMFAVARPSRILLACEGAQREDYLLPTVRGERAECLAMTEPEAGSDLRGMRTRAVRDGRPGSDWVITGTKHFISHADAADYVVLFAATGEDDSSEGSPRRARITAFLVDLDTPGLEVLPGYRSVSHRGYDNFVLAFDGARVPDSAVLGEVGRGFDVANTWLGTTRLQVAAVSLGRARRALDLAVEHAATVRHDDRAQPGRLLPARRHGDGAGGGEPAHVAGRGARRRRPAGRHGDRDGQAHRHRDPRQGRRRGAADPRRDGAHGRAAAGADLARCSRGADLGRHVGDPAAHHLPLPPAVPRWLTGSPTCRPRRT